jgi:predicted enzyme related to lactoylglutathione lyase
LDELSPDGVRWVELSPQGQTVKFYLKQYPSTTEVPPRRGTGYVFGMDDMMRTYKKLVKKGVQFVTEPSDKSSSIQFVDPDGNMFAITPIEYASMSTNEKK